MRIVIVGNGPASASAIEAFRQVDQDSEIIVLSDEPYPTYAPNCMENVIRGDISDSALFYKGGFEFYERYRVDFRPNKEVVGIDNKRKVVIVRGGEEIPYDKCLLAAGASAFIPPIPGRELGGVTTAKNLNDAKRIRDLVLSGKVKRVVIVGAGPIGVEDAETLRSMGLEVAVVEFFDRVLPRMLDKYMADRYMEILQREEGIEFYLNHQVVAIHGEDGWVEAVEVVQNGSDRRKFLRADLVILSDPDVYAAGDICSGIDAWGRHRWIALFPPAQQGGAVAGYNMAGLKVKHSGLVDYNAVKTRSVPAGSGGLFEDAESSLVFEYEEYLIKVFLKEDKVYGYQFVGRPTKRRLNQANPFLRGLDAKAFLNNRGFGLEASGVLFHHFIKQRDRTFSSEVIEVIKRGMLRSLGNPKFELPLFHRE